MAKIVITIEDQSEEEGRVRVTAEPSFATIMKIDVSGNLLTPAHGYAICAMNAIRNAAASESPIWVPPVRRQS